MIIMSDFSNSFFLAIGSMKSQNIGKTKSDIQPSLIMTRSPITNVPPKLMDLSPVLKFWKGLENNDSNPYYAIEQRRMKQWIGITSSLGKDTHLLFQTLDTYERSHL